jgi:hypothetical protein
VEDIELDIFASDRLKCSLWSQELNSHEALLKAAADTGKGGKDGPIGEKEMLHQTLDLFHIPLGNVVPSAAMSAEASTSNSWMDVDREQDNGVNRDEYHTSKALADCKPFLKILLNLRTCPNCYRVSGVCDSCHDKKIPCFQAISAAGGCYDCAVSNISCVPQAGDNPSRSLYTWITEQERRITQMEHQVDQLTQKADAELQALGAPVNTKKPSKTRATRHRKPEDLML